MDQFSADHLEQQRRYRLAVDGVANIKEYGAKGDGESDDTAAFEAAVDAITNNPCGGEVFVPAGSFCLSKRISIEPTRPFALKGIGPDVSRLLWTGEHTEGLAITPKGNLDACCNDGAVLVSGLALLCSASKGAKNAALLISGAEQIGELPNGRTNLTHRTVTRNRVTSVAMRGAWRYGLVLRSAHLAEVEHLSISGVGPGKGSAVAVLMDGGGAPTGHTLENIRAFHFATAIHLNSDSEKGRLEGVKIHNCNLVAVQTGIKADNVLELSAVQNHINCARAGIMATSVDQSFFIGNLIYQHGGGNEGHGIWIKGDGGPATSNTILGNCIVGVQGADKLKGITLDAGILGVTALGNNFIKNDTALHRPAGAAGNASNICFEGNVARNCNCECGIDDAKQSHIVHGVSAGGGGGGGGKAGRVQAGGNGGGGAAGGPGAGKGKQAQGKKAGGGGGGDGSGFKKKFFGMLN